MLFLRRGLAHIYVMLLGMASCPLNCDASGASAQHCRVEGFPSVTISDKRPRPSEKVIQVAAEQGNKETENNGQHAPWLRQGGTAFCGRQNHSLKQ